MVSIKIFRGDNGVYIAGEFRGKLNKDDQNVTFCGTMAHHQNGIAEISIRTIVEKTRTVLINVPPF